MPTTGRYHLFRLNVTTADLPTLRLGHRQYPVVLPSLDDARLHLAAVIVTIHVLGQIGLGFRVSIPQILVAIMTCAVIEVAWTLRRTGRLVWPASAMLTGSGVALILRLVGAEQGDHWSWTGWHVFALVAALSIATKYVVRYRGTHLFNPSNVGLVIAFVLLGSSRIEPLDFWWAPLNAWMTAAYLVILVGGLLITYRLGLLAMAVTFWVAFAGSIGVLAASGHCITAAWALSPVCGSQFWWVLITSPEVLVFLFFMITDPRTIPAGKNARIVFSLCLALLCTLLIAPHGTEFGAKVALLAGLVIMSPLRSLLDKKAWSPKLLAGRPLPSFLRGAAVGSALILVASAIIVAGAPARESSGSVEAAPAFEVSAFEVEVDPSTLPPVAIGPEVLRLHSDLADGGAARLALALAENLKIEGEAMLRGDQRLLLAADSGQRLIDMERRIDEAAAAGERLAVTYTFDSLALEVVFPNGPQGGAGLGVEARGVVEEITYDAGGTVLRTTTSPLAAVFVLLQYSEGWRIVDTLDLP